LAVEKADKFGLTDNHLFWNEIRKIRTAYRKARAKNPNISISAYADNPDKNYLDEFMAEAFAHAKCAEMGLQTLGFGKDYTYSKQVLEVIDKYFKLPKTEIGRQSVAFKSMDKRAARDPDTGKRVMVPADMTYPEWEKKFSNRTSSQNSLINDIIPRGSNRGVSKVSDVHYVGKLDKSLYECVTKDIRTDDVIITDERIQHIKDHHPKDYERFMQYFPLIVAAPDYIFEANLPNTAFLLKTFRTKNENFNIILRLATSDDPDNYSNSIITFKKISDKKARKYIRNKKKLYTRPNNSYNESS